MSVYSWKWEIILPGRAGQYLFACNWPHRLGSYPSLKHSLGVVLRRVAKPRRVLAWSWRHTRIFLRHMGRWAPERKPKWKPVYPMQKWKVDQSQRLFPLVIKISSKNGSMFLGHENLKGNLMNHLNVISHRLNKDCLGFKEDFAY